MDTRKQKRRKAQELEGLVQARKAIDENDMVALKNLVHGHGDLFNVASDFKQGLDIKDRKKLFSYAVACDKYEMIEYLMSEITITPNLMKDFLEKNPEIDLKSIAEDEESRFHSLPIEMLQHIDHFGIGNLKLSMFRKFLLDQLMLQPPAKPEVIMKILDDAQSNLKPNQYNQFMNESKQVIFIYSNFEIMQAANIRFGYSRDTDFLNKVKQDMKADVEMGNRNQYFKTLFIDEMLKKSTDLSQYDLLISKVINDVQMLVEISKDRSSSFLVDKSRFNNMITLLNSIFEIKNDPKISSAEKVWKIAEAIASTYNQICVKVNNSRFQKKSTTTEGLLHILEKMENLENNTNILNIHKKTNYIDKLETISLSKTTHLVIDQMNSVSVEPSTRPGIKK